MVRTARTPWNTISCMWPSFGPLPCLPSGASWTTNEVMWLLLSITNSRVSLLLFCWNVPVDHQSWSKCYLKIDTYKNQSLKLVNLNCARCANRSSTIAVWLTVVNRYRWQTFKISKVTFKHSSQVVRGCNHAQLVYMCHLFKLGRRQWRFQTQFHLGSPTMTLPSTFLHSVGRSLTLPPLQLQITFSFSFQLPEVPPHAYSSVSYNSPPHLTSWRCSGVDSSRIPSASRLLVVS